jgi:CRP/FNR family cyclic AMP-dependent transcriptional regulator
MLGVSRQSINRQLGLWQDQGLVRTSYGRIELLDPAQLARLTRT